MEDLTSPGVLADTGRVYASPNGSPDPQQRVRAGRCRAVRGMKRELGHEVLLGSGRFRSAITAIVEIAERQLLERTWRDRGGGESLADVGTIRVFASIPKPKPTRQQQALFRKVITETFVPDLAAPDRPFRPGLRVKGVAAHPGVFEMTWDNDGRATFSYGEERVPGQPHVIWRRIGTHAISPHRLVHETRRGSSRAG